MDSFRRDYLGGAFVSRGIQGPLGDEGSYDLLGVYVQNEMCFGRLSLIPGVRFSYASAEAERVDNPAVAGSDPSTPGNIISVDGDWSTVVGSLRAVYQVNRAWNVYGGVSQGFRTPTLYDLTSLDSTSVVETPSPDLDPEHAVSYEIGAKVELPRLRAQGAVWLTSLEDAIIRSPTGVLIGGRTGEVRKDNIGDGELWGFELEAAWRFHPASRSSGRSAGWTARSISSTHQATSWTVRSAGRSPSPVVSPFATNPSSAASGCKASGCTARTPTTSRCATRATADASRRVEHRAGTCSTSAGGVQLNRRAHLGITIENIFDENYRVHGSGQNMARSQLRALPGREVLGEAHRRRSARVVRAEGRRHEIVVGDLLHLHEA